MMHILKLFLTLFVAVVFFFQCQNSIAQDNEEKDSLTFTINGDGAFRSVLGNSDLQTNGKSQQSGALDIAFETNHLTARLNIALSNISNVSSGFEGTILTPSSSRVAVNFYGKYSHWDRTKTRIFSFSGFNFSVIASEAEWTNAAHVTKDGILAAFNVAGTWDIVYLRSSITDLSILFSMGATGRIIGGGIATDKPFMQSTIGTSTIGYLGLLFGLEASVNGFRIGITVPVIFDSNPNISGGAFLLETGVNGALLKVTSKL